MYMLVLGTCVRIMVLHAQNSLACTGTERRKQNPVHDINGSSRVYIRVELCGEQNNHEALAPAAC